MKHRRLLALGAAIFLLLLYASSIVFALIGSPLAQSLLMASLFCTIVVPAVLYGYLVVIRATRNRNENSAETKKRGTDNSGHRAIQKKNKGN